MRSVACSLISSCFYGASAVAVTQVLDISAITAQDGGNATQQASPKVSLYLAPEHRKSHEEIWARMRHLYPDAPDQIAKKLEQGRVALGSLAGRRSVSEGEMREIVAHNVNATKEEGNLEDGATPSPHEAAACFCQIACGRHFVSGKSLSAVDRDDLKTWKQIYGARGSGLSSKTQSSVECKPFGAKSIFTISKTTRLFGCTRNKSIAPGLSFGLDAFGGMAKKVQPALEDALGNVSLLSSRANVTKLKASPSAEVPRYILDFADTAIKGSRSTAIVVYHKGRMHERYALKATKDTKIHGWSMAKSILSLLVGLREAEGMLNMSAYAKAKEISMADKIKRGLTLQNLVNFRVGTSFGEDYNGNMLWGGPDTAEAAVRGTDGSKESRNWRYSSGMAQVLSRELRYTFPEERAGLAEYAAYPWKALFYPLGADSFTCEMDSAGTFEFSTFCYATARDWLKLGLLVLHEGKNLIGEQVVPAEYIHRFTHNNFTDNGDHHAYMWYRLDKVYGWTVPVVAARGAFGQCVIIVPSQELVVVRLGEEEGEWMPNWDSGNGPGAFSTLLDTMLQQRA